MYVMRRIREDEAPVVRELYRELVLESAERHPEDRIGISEGGLANMEEHFRRGASHPDVLCLVADDDGELIGFAEAEVTRGRKLPGAAGEIGSVWVRPGRDRAAVACRLAEEAVRRLRELGAGPIFHFSDIARPDPGPWEELGFERDVARYSLYGEGCS